LETWEPFQHSLVDTGKGRNTGKPRNKGKPRDTGKSRDTGKPRDTGGKKIRKVRGRRRLHKRSQYLKWGWII